jgi:hypothetical protein
MISTCDSFTIYNETVGINIIVYCFNIFLKLYISITNHMVNIKGGVHSQLNSDFIV